MANFRRERRETRERVMKLTLTLPCKVRQGWGKGSAIRENNENSKGSKVTWESSRVISSCKLYWWLKVNYVIIHPYAANKIDG